MLLHNHVGYIPCACGCLTLQKSLIHHASSWKRMRNNVLWVHAQPQTSKLKQACILTFANSTKQVCDNMPSKNLSSTYQVPIMYFSSNYQVPMKYLSSTYHVPIKYLSSTYRATIKYLLSTYQVLPEQLSSTSQGSIKTSSSISKGFIMFRFKCWSST